MFEQLEARALLTAVSWDGGGGDLHWNSPENWIDNVLPGSSDDVAIDVPVDITGSLVGSTTIESLQNAENLVVNGDLLVQGLSYNEGVVEV